MRSAQLRVSPNRLDFGKVKIPYQIRKGKRGEIRLGFGDAHVWIQTHSGRLGREEMEFVETKREWLQQHYQTLLVRQNLRAEFRSMADTHARIFGKTVPVQFIRSQRLYFKYEKGTLQIYLTDRHQQQPQQCVASVLQQMAKKYLIQRTEELARHCGVRYANVRIKRHRTKWGSCSSNRNINLNWYLIMVDKELIDYVIVHELMHLREMNHSPRFWNWVAKYIPHYKRLVERLRQNEWVIASYE
jgi:predicted metal-dependent hydrolase